MDTTSPDTKTLHFFISYASADQQWAEWIAWQLEDAGYHVALQAWDFHAGDNFVLKIDELTRDAERVIAVLSPNYFTSQYTATEWVSAFYRDPQGKSGLLVPIRVQDFDITGLLGPIAYIDFVGYNKDIARQRLLSSIDRRRRKPILSPRFPGPAANSVSSTIHNGSSPAFPGPIKSDTHQGSSLSHPVNIYISHADADHRMYQEFRRHLALLIRNQEIICWSKQDVFAGQDMYKEQEKHLQQAQIILLLISPDYFYTCYDEMEAALALRQQRGSIVVPILLHHSDWQNTPLKDFRPLPTSRLPISQTKNRDGSWQEVVKGLRQLISN